MQSFSRNGGLYYHMQHRLHNMHLVCPLFGMVRARKNRGLQTIQVCRSMFVLCVFLQLNYFSFLSFPRFSRNLRRVDSSECCVRRKPKQKHRRVRSHDFPKWMRADSNHARRRFKDCSCFECNRKDQQESRLHHREKICAQSGECRNLHRCMQKKRETSQICNKQIEHSNNYKSDDSLNKRNNTNANLKAIKSEYHVYKRS